jgi:hypothetical protein
MKLIWVDDASPQAFAAAVQQATQQPQVRAICVLAADANGWTPEALDPILQGATVPVVGGIFPQIIYGQQNHTQGAVLILLEQSIEWACLPHLSQPDADHDTPLATLAEQWEDLPGPATHLVLVDGLSTCIATLIQDIFANFGVSQSHLGGGAGSLSFQQKPCLLTPQGLVMDAALLVRLPLHSGVGVSHGWQAISEPFKVTQSHKNLVQQLEWKPAFSEYRQVVEAHSGQVFTDSNFFDLAKSYPLGISKLDAEVVVRDPLMLRDGEGLVCVGEVPEGAFVRILNGTPASLIEAAGQAAERAQSAYSAANAGPAGLALFIDCISRVLFMGDQIKEEFAAVAGDYPLVGALTLGEIANSGHDFLEFYNKTAVLGLLSDASA